MLILSAGEDVWIDIDGSARIRCRPPRPAMIIAARSQFTTVVLSDPAAFETALAAFNGALARSAITGWEGIALPGVEDVAEVTPDNIDLLMMNWDAYQAFDRDYVQPLLNAEAEKKGSRTSPGGTGAAAGSATAKPAPKSTTRASRVRGAAAKPARTAKTPARP